MAETPNLGITQLTEGQSQKEVTINTAFEAFDKALAGKLTKDIAGAVDITLTAAEWTYAMYEFTGNTTADLDIIVPTANRRFSVFNNTTGPPRTITIKTVAAPGVVLLEGEHMVVEQNGTVMIALTGGAGGGGAATLLELTDTPDTYTGQASKVLAVKTDETGTEFVTPAAGGGDTLWTRTLATPVPMNAFTACWQMEEASGNRLDSVAGLALTPVGGANLTQVAGRIGNAVGMNGTVGTYLTMANNAAVQMSTTQSFTIMCWVYLTALNGCAYVNKGNAGANAQYEYSLQLLSNKFTFAIANGTTYQNLSDPGAVPTLNQWYLVIGWYDAVANTVNLQINDGTVTSATATTTSYASTHAMDIGRWAGYASSPSLNGRIDLVGIGKRVLTSLERTQLWNGGAGLNFPFDTTTPSYLLPATANDPMLLGTTRQSSERLEVDGGIKVGNSTGTVNGTIRWTGTDLEVRKAGAWVSLTT